MKVAVLGCGPAGLVAAHTALNLGHKTTVFTNRVMPSQQYGCQYLHAPIPGYEDVPKARVSYQLKGTARGYRVKVYGDDWTGSVSPEDFIGDHDAWDIRETYRRLWYDLFMRKDASIVLHYVEHGDIGPAKWNDAVISTIPAIALCLTGVHEFRAHLVYAIGDKTPNGSTTNEIICDGTMEHEWYRKANVFGYETTEWPAQAFDVGPVLNPEMLSLPPLPPKWSVKVAKPLSTDCDCHPGVIRVGRFGSWTKSVLVHEVPKAVESALSG